MTVPIISIYLCPSTGCWVIPILRGARWPTKALAWPGIPRDVTVMEPHSYLTPIWEQCPWCSTPHTISTMFCGSLSSVKKKFWKIKIIYKKERSWGWADALVVKVLSVYAWGYKFGIITHVKAECVSTHLQSLRLERGRRVPWPTWSASRAEIWVPVSVRDSLKNTKRSMKENMADTDLWFSYAQAWVN